MGEVRSVKALINVDMIGDRDLKLVVEYNSDPQLRQMAIDVARQLGYPALFEQYPTAIEDDHIPFAKLGVPTLNLIDFSYGPDHRFWHTPEDTIDKLSAASFQTVGDLVLGLVQRLRSRP